MDRLNALSLFRQAANSGSFAAAARHAGTSPASVSKTIGELERELKVRLFNRTTRRMSLTEAGTLYLSQIAPALQALEDAEHALDPLHQAARGTLRVAAPLTIALIYLSRAIPDFLARHPELSLDLDLDDRRVDLVRDGYDVAVRGSDRLEDSSLIARKLTEIRHVLCAAPRYTDEHGAPSTPDDLRRHDCVRFTLSGHADNWEFSRNGRSVRVPVSGRYSVGSSLAVRDALLAGFGVSLIPEAYVRDDIAQGRLRVLLDDWSTVVTSLYAVYPSRRHPVAKLQVFLDFLSEAFVGADRSPELR